MIIGIMGGMGPAATKDAFEKIINLTNASKDREHIHIIIDNNTEIPDRTDFIMGIGESPVIEMVRSAIKLEMMGAEYIIIPCNTAHFFYEDIIKFTKSKILNMIEETALFLRIHYPENYEFLLLSTIGTYVSKVYENVFKSHGLKILEPSDSDKKVLMEWIYGIKAGIYVSEEEFSTLINNYINERNLPVILGCTELSSLTGVFGLNRDFIDPVLIIAIRCIEIAKGYKV